MRISGLLREKGDYVATVAPGTTVREVLAGLAEHGVGALVVTADGQRIDGIVSERDLVAAAATGTDFDGDTAAGAMSADVVCLRPADRLYDAAVDMLDLGIRHVPVVDERGTVEGIVSIRDLIRPLLVRSLEG